MTNELIILVQVDFYVRIQLMAEEFRVVLLW